MGYPGFILVTECAFQAPQSRMRFPIIGPVDQSKIFHRVCRTLLREAKQTGPDS
ncbi:unnamed protein product [Mycena citricolor]|uniref:Uncharacterized protein n=1 Tax=Mycena citricolor TaxID=2018698 RepID=A0AAD2HB65_9AGAR|nr:unnamed protein product [Mycena citricolor]